MKIENPNLNRFFNVMVNNLERNMARKRYEETDHDPLFLDPFSESTVRVLRTVAMLDKKFDNLLLKVFILGAEMTGGRNNSPI